MRLSEQLCMNACSCICVNDEINKMDKVKLEKQPIF